MENPRKTTLNVLLLVEQNGAYSNIALNKELSKHQLSAQDKALATAIIYGVLDRNITLEYVLKGFIKTPLKKVQPLTLMALKCALYQIMYMDKIPPSAAVNETVKLVKSSRERHNASFVNAVLRNILRGEIKLPAGDSIKDISVRYSCPEWIIESFVSDYGKENAEELIKASLETPEIAVRVNTIKSTAEQLIEKLKNEGVSATESDINNCLIINGSIAVSNSECYKQGLLHVQDIASQTVASKLRAARGERILDMCAAPGGKSFTIAEIMENDGEIVSCDIYENRVELIAKGANRLGLSIIKPTVCDATAFKSDLGLFDAVLCDVPCSGLGVIRRKPEIKYKKISDYADLPEIQLNILSASVKYLKEDGLLIYSTCTVRKAENEDVVSRFLSENDEFEVIKSQTLSPKIDGTDGFFYSVLKRKQYVKN